MLNDERAVLTKLRAIRGRYVDRKNKLAAEVASGARPAAWAAEETSKAHAAAVAEGEALLTTTGIELDVRKRLGVMQAGLVHRLRFGNAERVVEAEPGAVDVVVREVKTVQRPNHTPDPVLARTPTPDLERRALASTDLLETADIVRELRFRHVEQQNEPARMALYAAEQRALELAADVPHVKQRAELVPALREIQEYVQVAKRALVEDTEDPSRGWEAAAAVSAALARGEVTGPGILQPDGTLTVRRITDAA